MTLKPESIQTLVSAGLTILQAKVFLAIVQARNADAKTISKIADVDRSNVYRTILGLQELGIIIKLIQTPNTYIAIPPEQVLSTLLKKKKTEYQDIRTKSQKLLQQLAYPTPNLPSTDEYLLILPGKGPFYRRWESTVKNIQNNIDVIASERREPQDVPVLESYIPLLNRGIEVRAILDRSEHNDEEFYLRIKQFQALLEYPNWKVRFSFSSQRPFVAVKDNSLAVITLDPTALFKHSRTLWTNNPSIVATVQHRFDTLWNLAQEYKP